MVSNALEFRELVTTWGFSVPEPIAITKLSVAVDDNDDAISNNTNATTGWTIDNVPDMLQYHDELQRHREHQAEEDGTDETLDSEAKGRKRKKQASSFTWGDYDMDGCVHKVSDFSQRAVLGASNRSPGGLLPTSFLRSLR